MSRKRHLLRDTLDVVPLANRLVVFVPYLIMLDCEGTSLVRSRGSIPIESYLGLQY